MNQGAVTGPLGAVLAAFERIAAEQRTIQANLNEFVAGMAELAGWGFVNNGVTSKFENVYYPGTMREQIERACKAANIITRSPVASRECPPLPKPVPRLAITSEVRPTPNAKAA